MLLSSFFSLVSQCSEPREAELWCHHHGKASFHRRNCAWIDWRRFTDDTRRTEQNCAGAESGGMAKQKQGCHLISFVGLFVVHSSAGHENGFFVFTFYLEGGIRFAENKLQQGCWSESRLRGNVKGLGAMTPTVAWWRVWAAPPSAALPKIRGGCVVGWMCGSIKCGISRHSLPIAPRCPTPVPSHSCAKTITATFWNFPVGCHFVHEAPSANQFVVGISDKECHPLH